MHVSQIVFEGVPKIKLAKRSFKMFLFDSTKVKILTQNSTNSKLGWEGLPDCN